MKKILITGSTGALGQAVIKQIKHSSAYQVFTTSSKSKSLSNDKINEFHCDLRNPEQLKELFHWANPDLILHLGAVFSGNLAEVHNINVTSSSFLLDLIHDHSKKTRMILVGSSAEYGVVKPDDNPITEQRVLFPVSIYGMSKAWQTQLLGLYANKGVDVVCARIFNLFGPGLSEKLFAGRIQNQINSVKNGEKTSIEVGSLNAIRDYVSTTEAARQLLLIAANGESGNVYHVGSGEPVTMRNFLLKQLKENGLSDSLIQEAASHSTHQGYDVPMIYADMNKTRRLEKNLSGTDHVKT